MADEGIARQDRKRDTEQRIRAGENLGKISDATEFVLHFMRK
jgi:hypothetical protein